MVIMIDFFLFVTNNITKTTKLYVLWFDINVLPIYF